MNEIFFQISTKFNKTPQTKNKKSTKNVSLWDDHYAYDEIMSIGIMINQSASNLDYMLQVTVFIIFITSGYAPSRPFGGLEEREV